MNRSTSFIFNFILLAALALSPGCTKKVVPDPDPDPDPTTEEDSVFFTTRGAIISWADVKQPDIVDWLAYARNYHLNTLCVLSPPFNTQTWEDFKTKCAKGGIGLEWENHMIDQVLPRGLFTAHPEYFRVDEKGARNNDYNGCPSNKEALAIVAKNTKSFAKLYAPTNNKYYFWMSDGGKKCNCPLCNHYSASDQALIYENVMIDALREINPKAQLAHLAYAGTTEAPTQVKPHEGIFLEFAPFYRSYDAPLADRSAIRYNWTHGQYLDMLADNLKVFPASTAQVLEYWTDITLFSNWDINNKVKLPWNESVFKSDLETYANYGIHSITAYMIWAGPDYYAQYRDLSFIMNYAMGLYTYRPKKN
jgi:hypothetical protein